MAPDESCPWFPVRHWIEPCWRGWPMIRARSRFTPHGLLSEAPTPAATLTPRISLDNQSKKTLRCALVKTARLLPRDAGASPRLHGGRVAATGNTFDREITFATPISVVDWATGAQKKTGALLRVQTRPSILYTRLFAALGDFAKGVEYPLLFAR